MKLTVCFCMPQTGQVTPSKGLRFHTCCSCRVGYPSLSTSLSYWEACRQETTGQAEAGVALVVR